MNDDLVSSLKVLLAKSLAHLEGDLKKLQIGRASVSLVEDLMIEAYGTQQPLKALATLSTPDSHTISIQPWDKGILGVIDTALQKSDISITPMNDGHVIRLFIPQPTEERRKEFCKSVHQKGEEAKISVRNDRHTVFEKLKKQKEAKTMPEDYFVHKEKELQKLIDEANASIERMVDGKEAEIMKV